MNKIISPMMSMKTSIQLINSINHGTPIKVLRVNLFNFEHKFYSVVLKSFKYIDGKFMIEFKIDGKIYSIPYGDYTIIGNELIGSFDSQCSCMTEFNSYVNSMDRGPIRTKLFSKRFNVD